MSIVGMSPGPHMNPSGDDIGKVTLGEVYRLCLEIRAEVKAQNGRVTALEKDAVRIKVIWSAVVVIMGLFVDSIKHKLGLQ